MRLSPIEIRQHRFTYRFRGLDADEVRAFLETLVGDFDQVVRENAELRREGERLVRELAGYQSREQLIQDTLTAAQGVVKQLKQTAMKEAEVLVSEAEVRAERMLKDSELRRADLTTEIADLKQMRERVALELRNVLNGYLRFVEPIDPGEARAARPARTFERSEPPKEER
jgi:cell division initiation protein